jgi:rSAM/selenodomain-associated transferase 1
MIHWTAGLFFEGFETFDGDPFMKSMKIIVFIKAPVMGAVKTRLAATLGNEKTLGVYRCFIRDTLDKAMRLGDVTVCYTPASHARESAECISEFVEQIPQADGDLGEKMFQAFHREFEKGASSVVLMGSDAPDVPVSFLEEACDSLKQFPAVIGPVEDGGYFLIGFTRKGFTRDVFQEIPWSTPVVFEKTLEILKRNRISCHILPPWQDVDTGEDYDALIRRLGSGTTKACHVWEFVRENGHHRIDHHTGSS